MFFKHQPDGFFPNALALETLIDPDPAQVPGSGWAAVYVHIKQDQPANNFFIQADLLVYAHIHDIEIPLL